MLLIATIVLLVVVFIFATHPLWLGSALRPVLARYDVTFSSYQKISKERFVLTDVTYSNATAQVRLGRLEAFLPLVWRQKALRPPADTNEIPVFLEISGWKVVVSTNRAQRKSERSAPDVYPLFKKFEEQLALARKWLPRASMANGILDLRGREYNVGSVIWDQGKFTADGVWPETAVPVELKADLDGQGPYQLSYAMHPLDIRFRLRLLETNNALTANFLGFYKENQGTITAQFATNGWLPERATIKADGLAFEGETLGFPQIEQVSGSVNATWRTNGFRAHVKAAGEPASEYAAKVPPLEVDISASGDTNRVFIEKLVAVTPGLQARVEEPVWISTRGELLSSNVNASVVAELEKFPWFKASGKVRGRISAQPGSNRIPVLHAEFTGESLAVEGVQAESLTGSLHLEWPVLRTLQAVVQFDSNSVARLTLGADLQKKMLVDGALTATGAIARALLPTNYTYDHLRLSASFSGALTQLNHSGEVELLGLKAPGLARTQLEAKWQGRQFELHEGKFRARAGPAVLLGDAGIERGPSGRNLAIRELTLRKGDEVYLALANPAALSLQPGTNGFSLFLTNFAWSGPERGLLAHATLTWPHRGQIGLTATNIHPELFQFFSERSLRGVKLEKVAADFSWAPEQALSGTIEGRSEFIQDPLQEVQVQLKLEAREQGVQLANLELRDQSGPFLAAQGFLPVRFFPAGEQKVDWIKEGTMDFSARSTTNEHFWNNIAKISGVALSNPVVALELKNKVRDPRIALELAAAEIRYLKTTNDLPRVHAIRADLALSERTLLLNNLRFKAEDQPLQLRGKVHLGTNFWSSRREELIAYVLQNSDLHLLGTNLAIAPFTRFFPQYLAPEGTVMINAGVRTGMQFTGQVRLQNLSTRPLPHVGVVENVGVNLVLSNRVVHLPLLRADVGGETLRVKGVIDLAPKFIEAGFPAVNLTITGQNIPLARNPDVILRSDLDLEVITQATNRPVVRGLATLRESVLMRDIDTLAPGRVTKPRRRPPFFSFEMDPIDDWQLDLRVRGENFMRVRSPFFMGLASANFKIEGTAREPLALGEVTLASGVVAFPFANLSIRQGIISMTSENPYVPHVFVTARGRSFGFDINMQAEGPAHEPVLTFSSVPALTSEEIVLMLTTGQIPRQDFNFTNEQRASKLAFFLGKSLWSKFRGDSGEEKLEIRSGEDISEQGRQTYAVEYKMTDRWSLVGEYDRFGALNAGVKWKIYTR